MGDTLLAGKRDASWYARPRDPGTESGRDDYCGKYHVNVGDSEYATAACGPIIVESSLTTAAVAEHMRCMRPGCRARWPNREGRQDG